MEIESSSHRMNSQNMPTAVPTGTSTKATVGPLLAPLEELPRKSPNSSAINLGTRPANQTTRSKSRPRLRIPRAAKTLVSYKGIALGAKKKQHGVDARSTPSAGAKGNENNSKTARVNTHTTSRSSKFDAISAPTDIVTPRIPDSTTFGDVICGRSGGGFRNSGHAPNVRFQRLLQYFLDMYNACSMSGVEKRTMCTMILDFVFEQGGRLIRHDDASKRWERLPFKKCYSKVTQTFRDLRCKNSSSKEPKIKHRPGKLTHQEQFAWEHLRARIRERLGLPPENAEIIAARALLATTTTMTAITLKISPQPPCTRSSSATDLASTLEKRRHVLPLKKYEPPYQTTSIGNASAVSIRRLGSSEYTQGTNGRPRPGNCTSMDTRRDHTPTPANINGGVVTNNTYATEQLPEMTLAPRSAVPSHVSLKLVSDAIEQSSHTSSLDSSTLQAFSHLKRFGEAYTLKNEESVNITEVVFKSEEIPYINSYDTPQRSNRTNRTYEAVSPTLERILAFSPLVAISAPITAQPLVTPINGSPDDPLLFLADPLDAGHDDHDIDAGFIHPGSPSMFRQGSIFHDTMRSHPLGDRVDNHEDGKSELLIPRLRELFDIPAISDDEDSYTQRIQDMIFLSSEPTGEIMETISPLHAGLKIEDEMDDPGAWGNETLSLEEVMTPTLIIASQSIQLMQAE